MSYLEIIGGGGGGSGTVTNTGTLTSGNVIIGNGGVDEKIDTAISTDAAGAITDAQGIITTSKPALTSTQTWNAAGVTFNGLSQNITATASAAGSSALSVGVGGADLLIRYNSANGVNPQLMLGVNMGAAGATAPAIAQTGSGGTGIQLGSVVAITQAGSYIVQVPSVGLNAGSAKVYGFSSNANPALAVSDTAISRTAAAIIAVGNGTAADKTGLIQSGMTVFVAANFTTSGAGTALEAITGLSITVPAVAANWKFHAHLAYSQAVGTAAVGFGIQAVTNNPTNIFATGEMFTAAGTVTTGVLATLATTTATQIVSGTPGATGTNLVTDIYGTAELGASANTIRLLVSTATAADLVTVLRGSYFSFCP